VVFLKCLAHSINHPAVLTYNTGFYILGCGIEENISLINRNYKYNMSLGVKKLSRRISQLLVRLWPNTCAPFCPVRAGPPSVYSETIMGAVQVSRARDVDMSRLGLFCIRNLSTDSV